MKKSEFNKVDWEANQVVEYSGIRYPVCEVNKKEKLVGLIVDEYDTDIPLMWVRCENAELVK